MYYLYALIKKSFSGHGFSNILGLLTGIFTKMSLLRNELKLSQIGIQSVWTAVEKVWVKTIAGITFKICRIWDYLSLSGESKNI